MYFDEDDDFSEIQQELDRKAIESYPDGVEVKYCPICNHPMVYKSISYYEGFSY